MELIVIPFHNKIIHEISIANIKIGNFFNDKSLLKIEVNCLVDEKLNWIKRNPPIDISATTTPEIHQIPIRFFFLELESSSAEMASQTCGDGFWGDKDSNPFLYHL